MLSIPSTIQQLYSYFDIPSSERNYLMAAVQKWAIAQGHTSLLIELGRVSSPENVADPIADIPLITPVKKQPVVRSMLLAVD
jgi:hypothetical protein